MRESPEMAERVFGPEPILDSTQMWVWECFMRLRSTTPEELGISLPDDMAPILARLLRAMDLAYRRGAAEAMKAKMARDKSAPPPPAQAR